jgi:hypothetical protein
MKYQNEGEAISRLKRNGIQVKFVEKIVLANKDGIGIKLWGAIDYLKRYGYAVSYERRF